MVHIILRYEEFRFLDFSSAISRTGITCICPKPKYRISYDFTSTSLPMISTIFFRLLGGWKLPILPFSLKIWTTVIITFSSVFLSLLAIKMIASRMENGNRRIEIDVTYIILQLWSILLLQSIRIV